MIISLYVVENSSGTVEYYHQDHLGSTRLKTDADGDEVYSSNYEPFGPSYGESGTEEFRYTGKREDNTGLYYYGARYYHPETGRFITEDPVSGSIDDPQSLNRYVYCMNNPHKYIDPDGENPFIVSGFLVGAFFSGIPYYLRTRDFTGAVIRGVIGGVAGAVTGATFGMAAWIMAPSEVSMTAAAASLVLKGTVAAGAISTVSGRGCEHSLTTAAQNAGLIEGEAETVSIINVGTDAIIGGGSAGVTNTIDYVVGIAGYFNPELDMHVRQAEEALSRGETSAFSNTYILITESLARARPHRFTSKLRSHSQARAISLLARVRVNTK